jgi:hypothetical protein
MVGKGWCVVVELGGWCRYGGEGELEEKDGCLYFYRTSSAQTGKPTRRYPFSRQRHQRRDHHSFHCLPP